MAAENLIQILLTSIIQGITEFLPVSSSGHISFLNELFNWSDIKLTLMVSAHFGTLFAVMYYFRCDVKKFFISGFFSHIKKKFFRISFVKSGFLNHWLLKNLYYP